MCVLNSPSSCFLMMCLVPCHGASTPSVWIWLVLSVTHLLLCPCCPLSFDFVSLPRSDCFTSWVIVFVYHGLHLSPSIVAILLPNPFVITLGYAVLSIFCPLFCLCIVLCSKLWSELSFRTTGVNVWPTHIVTPVKSAEKYEGGVLDTPRYL